MAWTIGVYAAVGYSGGAIKVNDVEHNFKQALYRFRPDGTDFEVLTSTSNNTWGLGINEAGDVFASTANDEHSVFLGIPNRYFERVRGWHGAGSAGIADHKEYHPIADDVRQMDWHGGFTAATGHELYTARVYPREYWNRAALVCEPTGHLVHVDWLAPQGSSFAAHDGFNLFASTDPWSAPVAAQVGPDGAVWILDWYNYVVQHNPTPHGFETGPGNAYETPLRDRVHGRVYRVVPSHGTKHESPRLDRDDTAGLLAALANDNMFWRLQAQRLLVERGRADVVPQLVNLVTSTERTPAVLHSIWALAGLRDAGAIAREPDPFAQLGPVALKGNDPAVRRAALELLPRTAESAALILGTGCLDDPQARVRLAALLALAEMPPSAAVAERIVAILSQPELEKDRWLPLAATSAGARCDAAFLDVVARRPADAPIPEPLLDSVRVVAEHFARGKPGVTVNPLIHQLPQAERSIAETVVTGLAAGWPADEPPPVDKALEESLAALLRHLPGSPGLPVITLANRWGAGGQLARDRARDASLAPRGSRRRDARRESSPGGDRRGLGA